MAIKIAFLVHNENLIPWLQEEVKAFPYDALFGSEKPADAYVVLAQGEEDAEAFLPIVEGHMFAWYGDGAEKAATLDPFEVNGDWNTFSADDLVTTANDMHEKLQAQKEPPQKRIKPLLRRRDGGQETEQGSHEDEEVESFGTDTELVDPQVIAVGGNGGASFVAWNLATITKLPLIEGNEQGSLAKWTGIERSVHEALEDTLPYGTILTEPLPKTIIGKRVIVDTGSDPKHPVFQHARIRIWVTTLDAAHPPIPERSRVVVNRIPEPLPFSPRDIVQTNIDLLVPDVGLEALLAQFTHIPWITKQDEVTQSKWKALVKLAQTQNGGTDTWASTGW